MPITKQAKKKMRSDLVRRAHNKRIRDRAVQLVKKARKNPNKKSLSIAFKVLDKATKTHVFHPNKAARLKSRLSRLLKKK